MENIPENTKERKPGLTFDEMVRLGELGLEGFKWFDAQGTESIKTAARVLWLSNAGGLALVVGYAAKVETMPLNATLALIASAIVFIAGVFFGVIPHVSIAHRITALQVFVADLAFDVFTKRKSEAEIQAEALQLLAKWRDKKGVITQYLVLAKWCLAIGAILGVLALGLKFLPLFK